jgi:CheY-like chemotaxis protein
MPKVLVVDDDAMIVDLLKLQLETAGYAVATAADAYAGVEAAKREHPDLITLDFSMPAGNGIDLYLRLRGVEATRSTPMIFLSAGLKPETLWNSIPRDAKVRFLPKPIDMKRLLILAAQLGVPPAAKPPSKKPSLGNDDEPPQGEILDLDA